MDDKELDRLAAEIREREGCRPRRKVRQYHWHPCAFCGSNFLAARSTARFCSVRCRVANNRNWRRKFGERF